MEISNQVSKEINEIFCLASTTSESTQFMSQMIQILMNIGNAESSVCNIPNDPQCKKDIKVNLHERFNEQYREYYHKFDPVQYIDTLRGEEVVRLMDYIDYKAFISGEFYNDFLKPQKIHHKLYVKLYSDGKYYGRIGLYRNIKEKPFSKREAGILGMVSPYLGHAISHHNLLSKHRKQNIFNSIVDENSSKGFLLFDETLQLISMNLTAKNFCHRILDNHSNLDTIDQIPSILLQDCRSFSYTGKRQGKGSTSKSMRRIIQITDSPDVSVVSKKLSQEETLEGKNGFLIAIEEMPPAKEIKRGHLEAMYGLTKRESEIACHIFNGLKNLEIADKVCLSEITVKKHIQSIYTKLNVSNRVSVVRKIVAGYQEFI